MERRKKNADKAVRKLTTGARHTENGTVVGEATGREGAGAAGSGGGGCAARGGKERLST